MAFHAMAIYGNLRNAAVFAATQQARHYVFQPPRQLAQGFCPSFIMLQNINATIGAPNNASPIDNRNSNQAPRPFQAGPDRGGIGRSQQKSSTEYEKKKTFARLIGFTQRTIGRVREKASALLGWASTSTPTLNGIGPFKFWHLFKFDSTVSHAAYGSTVTLTLSPDASQTNRFYKALAGGVRAAGDAGGRPTRQEADQLIAFLHRLESDSRTAPLLNAVVSYYAITGRTPSIVLDKNASEPGATTRSPSDRQLTWRLNAALLADYNTPSAALALIALYKDMLGIPRFSSRPCLEAIGKGKVPVDRNLEKAWNQWINARPGVQDLRAQIVNELRAAIQQMRFYGGVSSEYMLSLLESRALQTEMSPSTLILNENSLCTGLPPLPADLKSLELCTDAAPSLHTLPPHLESLKIKTTSPGGMALPTVPDSLGTLVIEGEIQSWPPDYRFPTGLHTLVIKCESSGELIGLPLLPDGLKTLIVQNLSLGMVEDPLPSGLEHLELSHCGLVTAPRLPAELKVLKLNGNYLVGFRDPWPSGLITIDMGNNLLTALPPETPRCVEYLNLSHNFLRELPPGMAQVPSRLINVSRNAFTQSYIRNLRANATSRIDFDGVRSARHAGSSTEVIQSILGNDHPQAAGRWQAIRQAALADPKTAESMAEFERYLVKLCRSKAYWDQTFRTEVLDTLVELSKPHRQSLREVAWGICEDVGTICLDRAAWMMSELRKAKVNDDILLGFYDGRPAEVIDIARQIFRLDVLTDIAHAKATALGMFKEELEVHLAYGVALRPAHELGLSTVVSAMDYSEMVRLTNKDLKHAKDLVLARERADFDTFFVTQYEPWQNMLKRKFGQRYEDAMERLATQTTGKDFEHEVDAKLAEMKIPLNDLTARIRAGAVVTSAMQYKTLLPFTQEYLQSVNVSYQPVRA